MTYPATEDTPREVACDRCDARIEGSAIRWADWLVDALGTSAVDGVYCSRACAAAALSAVVEDAAIFPATWFASALVPPPPPPVNSAARLATLDHVIREWRAVVRATVVVTRAQAPFMPSLDDWAHGLERAVAIWDRTWADWGLEPIPAEEALQ